MNIAALAFKYRPIVLTVVFLTLVWGVYTYLTMPRREDPEYSVRTCTVSVRWPGAPAVKVEELVTKPLEEACDRIDEVKEVRSTTLSGQTTIFVDLEEQVPAALIDNVWDKVRADVAKVSLPEPELQAVVNSDFGDTYILLAAIYQKPLPGESEIDPNNEYSLRELDVISERIKDQLRLLDGVAKCEQFGVVDEAIYAEMDAETWAQLGLGASDLERLTAARNIVAPGGDIETPQGRFSVVPGGELNAADELNRVVAGFVGDEGLSRMVYLKDMGIETVRDYVDPRNVICRFSDANTSRPCVIVAVSMKSGANIIKVCNAAKVRLAEMKDLEKTIPPDIGVELVSDQSVNVEGKISQVLGNVVGAVVIVVIVVYLVVGMRSAIVMAANIPIVVLASIAIVSLFGVQLEQISLASIIIALGLLVDNAVQVCDQSRTNQIQGMDPKSATIKGTMQLSNAMLMGTATTIAAFAPMLIGLVGSSREYVYSLPVTLSITLAVSWLLAMSFCSILAAAFVRAPTNPDEPSAPLAKLYALFTSKRSRASKKPSKPNKSGLGDSEPDTLFRRVVRAAIDYKMVTIGVSLALFVSLYFLPLATEFFPKDIRDQFPIKIWLPENASIEQTDLAAKQVERILQKLSPVVDADGKPVLGKSGQPLQRISGMRTMVGRGGSRWYLSWDPEPPNPAHAEILIRTTDGKYTADLVRRVREIAERGDESLGLLPVVGARVVPQELQLGPSKAPVEIRLSGPGFADMRTMRKYASQVKDIVRNAPGAWDVSDSWGIKGYELVVDVDEDRANLAGITNIDVARSLNAYYSGHPLTTFREGDHQVPVYLRLKREQRTTLEGLKTTFVQGSRGYKAPLDSFANVRLELAPAKIERRNLNRVIAVTAEVESGVQGNDLVKSVMNSEAITDLMAELPAGYELVKGGNLEKSEENAGYLAICLAISILTIVMLLVIQYNGWAKPMIILATLPLALIGALPGLSFTGNALGFMPQLGILSLFGIVLNTGIIFVEFADLLIEQAAEDSDGSGPICGLTASEFRSCLVEACQQRFLPIFLTTATTIGGLLPLALGGGPLWTGMSWAMICGLLVSTALTLLVVPALYAFFVEVLGVQPVRIPPRSDEESELAGETT